MQRAAQGGAYIAPDAEVRQEVSRKGKSASVLYVINPQPYPVSVRLEPSCGCVEVDLEPCSISPFGFRKITLEVDGALVPPTGEEKELRIHMDWQSGHRIVSVPLRYTIPSSSKP
ncbi:hypothetical protein EON81_01150 [bacterium]|nr:MAG: hypothetical protein EON81_01150 [bacterium]